MADFNVRSDSVNVEQIMEQIRARIREKRGIDYTEEQIRELAAVKLEKFLDPRGVRSDLLEQFKQHQPRYSAPDVPSFVFEDTTMFETHRGALRFIRKLLAPLLKLLFNPNAIVHALHTQADINKATLQREAAREQQRRDIDALYFEVIHNLVVEVTRTGIEVKNLKMQVESLASRLEFNERRSRALESAVVYKPQEEEPVRRATPPQPIASPPPPRPPQAAPTANAAPAVAPTQGPGGQPPEGPGQRSRRRRRRRGRRSGAPAAAIMGAPGTTPGTTADSAPASEPSTHDDHDDHDDDGPEESESHAAAAQPIGHERAVEPHAAEPSAESHSSLPAADTGPLPPSSQSDSRPGGSDPDAQ